MDSPWICNSIGLAASTLVHEFQHMINFSRKSGSSTWFNEMLSMVCEEVLASPMGIYEKNTPRNRLFQFCEGYWKRGLTTWISDDSVLYSYAMSFAFGAFLIRNYGGIPLLQEIASNSSLNKNSIEDALMARGIDKTFDQVFTEFVISLVLKDGSEQSSASFNKSLEYNIGGSNFSIPTINLDDYSVKLSDGTSTKGPVLFDAGKEGQMDLHPYGFSLHEIGSTSEDGTLTLNFSKAVSADEKIYVLVK